MASASYSFDSLFDEFLTEDEPGFADIFAPAEATTAPPLRCLDKSHGASCQLCQPPPQPGG
jgi:hypothetical protein